MSRPLSNANNSLAQLAAGVLNVAPLVRPRVLRAALAFLPGATIEESFLIGELRARLAESWECLFGEAVPVGIYRAVVDPPLPIRTVLGFSQLERSNSERDTVLALRDLLVDLRRSIVTEFGDRQRELICDVQTSEEARPKLAPAGELITNLRDLIDQGRRFATIYADPPWQYDNTASRAAADNHYPTMSLGEICAEPVPAVVEQHAHLHLWTTSSFLREAFQVMDAWGFRYKSSFVWIKEELGLGNYWRVSHEYMLLGVRGQLRFSDRTLRSWHQSPRLSHSRKPGVIRQLIERASPGPYLELYRREQWPNSAWTVYGNQVEPRLF